MTALQCIYREGCMSATTCIDHCRARELGCDPMPRYSCFVEGCPGNHPSKRGVCEAPAPQSSKNRLTPILAPEFMADYLENIAASYGPHVHESLMDIVSYLRSNAELQRANYELGNARDNLLDRLHEVETRPAVETNGDAIIAAAREVDAAVYASHRHTDWFPALAALHTALQSSVKASAHTTPEGHPAGPAALKEIHGCTGKHGSQAECDIVQEMRSLLQVAFTAIRTQHFPPSDWFARAAVVLGIRNIRDEPYQWSPPERTATPCSKERVVLHDGHTTLEGASQLATEMHELAESLAAGSNDSDATVMSKGAVIMEMLICRVVEMAEEIRRYKAWAASCDPTAPDMSAEYSIQLQRLIEAFCRGDELPYPELHHSQKLAKWRKAQFVLLDVPEESPLKTTTEHLP